MKPLLLFINAVLLISIAYFCVQIFYNHIGNRFFIINEPSQAKVQKKEPVQTQKKDSFKEQNEKIIQRNLFKVQIQEKEETLKDPLILPDNLKDTLENLKPIDLDLTLWGTVTGTKYAYAVIEDKKNKVQALYQIGDKVQKAVLKKILRDKVVLRYDQKDYILEVDMEQIPDTSAPGEEMPEKKAAASLAKEIMVKKSLITSSLKNIEALKRQIRIKPLASGGKSNGLLVYSIKPDSLFHTLGLQNGDIIRKVNGNPTTSFEDAARIYQDLKENISKIKVTVLRNGKHQELEYHINADENGN